MARKQSDQGLRTDRALGAQGKDANLPLRRAGLSPVDASCRSATPVNNNAFEGVLTIRSFGYRLEPRYIFRAGRLDQ